VRAWILEHGKTTLVYESRRTTAHTAEVVVGGVSYAVDFGENQEVWHNLVVIDGVLLPHGLPRSARILRNVPAGRTQFWYDGEIPERRKATSPIGKVCRGGGLPFGAQLLELPDMLDYHKVKDGMVEVTFARWFIALQKSQVKQTLFFRYKPVSFERQYINIVSLANEVKFITQNHR